MGGIAPRTSLESCHQHVMHSSKWRVDKCLPNKTSRESSNAQTEAGNSLYNFTAFHKSRNTTSRRYAIRIKGTKESRTGVIVHRRLRAEFVEAIPNVGP